MVLYIRKNHNFHTHPFHYSMYPKARAEKSDQICNPTIRLGGTPVGSLEEFCSSRSADLLDNLFNPLGLSPFGNQHRRNSTVFT
ncbi:hypothetical protein Holit_01557 [Hollandina sp. SP2]